MPKPNPEALSFLLHRRSRPAKTLVGPAPDRSALEPILTAGLRVPDHGKLEPWRLIVLSGAAATRLGDIALRRGLAKGMDREQAEKASLMFTGAPLMIAVVSEPLTSEKIPQSEQLLSAGAVCLSLVNAALAAGWGANWLTGWTATNAGFLAESLNLTDGAVVAGYIVVGTETSPPPERPRPDTSQKVSWIEA